MSDAGQSEAAGIIAPASAGRLVRNTHRKTIDRVFGALTVGAIIWLIWAYRTYYSLSIEERIRLESLGVLQLVREYPELALAAIAPIAAMALWKLIQWGSDAASRYAVRKEAREGSPRARYDMAMDHLARARLHVEFDDLAVGNHHTPGLEERTEHRAWRLWDAVALRVQPQESSKRREHLQQALHWLLLVPAGHGCEPEAQYLAGLISLRGSANADPSTAHPHFQRARELGHAKAACEQAFLLLAGEKKAEARALLRETLPRLGPSRMCDVARLQLALLDLEGTEDLARDLAAAEDAAHDLLSISMAPANQSSARDQPSTKPESFTPMRIRREADSIRLAIALERRSEQERELRERARTELYSFITHSIPSAMTTVAAEATDSLEVLQSTTDISTRERDYLIRSLSSTLGRAALIDGLMATHRLLIAGRGGLRDAWLNDTVEITSPAIVLVDAIKQATAQALFTDLDYSQLDIPTTDDLRINRVRELALHQLIGKTTSIEDCDAFIAFLALEFPFMTVALDKSITWRSSRNGVRFGILLSIVSELVRNALRYRRTQSGLTIDLSACTGGFVITVTNLRSDGKSYRSDGTRRGLVFIREFVEAVPAIAFAQSESDDRFTAKLTVGEPALP